MSENYLIQQETLTDIADAIREINGEAEQYTPSEMAGEIRNIKTVIDQLDESKLVATATGESIVLTDSSDKPLEGLVLYGKTTQDGTPSPTNPIPLVNAGVDGDITVSVSNGSETQTLTVSTPNSLPGIPVTSGGNYTDENGQQWVCDYKDYERGVYVQRAGIVDYTDSTATAPLWSVTGTSGKYRFNIEVDAKGAAASEVMPLFCNITSAVSSDHTWLCQEGVANSSSGNGLWLYLDVLSTKTSTEALAWLRENQVKIQYMRTAPVEKPLTAEEITAYQALYTNKPVTTILNDGGAGMSVSYVADTKAYIDNKFAALEAAILSTGGNV